MTTLSSAIGLLLTCAGIYLIGKTVYEGISKIVNWAFDRAWAYFFGSPPPK